MWFVSKEEIKWQQLITTVQERYAQGLDGEYGL